MTSDPKERAEHVMLIDLARNDVGRVSKAGSVRVPESMVVERYSHVMHIVSEVQGELVPAMGPWDVIRATFPAGMPATRAAFSSPRNTRSWPARGRLEQRNRRRPSKLLAPIG